MKQLFILHLIIVCTVIQSFAQNKNIDSLFTLIKTDKEDTNKVIHLYKVCGQFINKAIHII